MKSKEEGYHYTLMFADTQKIIKHCDKRIEYFFAKLNKETNKKIEKYVKAEVRRIMKGKK